MTPHVRFRPLIRLFVSSTFSDFVHERDALQRTVWPKLEQHCDRRGFQFQAIDLRWGVSAEAGLDHRTMRICFDELRRAQEVSPEPNFLVLLGDRYGWRPLPEALSVQQFARLQAAARAKDDFSASLHQLEEWYPLDSNNRPPVHALKSRIGTSTAHDPGAWSAIEAVLWRIINQVYPREQFTADRFQLPVMPPEDRFGQPPFPEIVRFQSSATEQEIWGGALTIDDPARHLLACFRQIENRADFQSGRMSAAAARDHFNVIEGRVDPDLGRFQDELKHAVRARLSTGPAAASDSCFDLRSARLAPRDDGEAPWSIALEDAYRASLQAMCDWIERRLTSIIDRQIDQFHGVTEPAPAGAKAQGPAPRRLLELEHAEHERFGRERSETFVGRAAELQQIVSYCLDANNSNEHAAGPLLVHGSSGCGKSALMARAAALLGSRETSEAGDAPIVRYLGISPPSSRLCDLLASLCQELQPETVAESVETRTVSEWIDESRARLRAAASRRPVVLMLDALDQLADIDDLQELRWLPRVDWPPQLRIVISCLSDREPTEAAGRAWQTLHRLFPRAATVPLDALSEPEAAQLLFTEALPRSGRTLTEAQRRRIEPLLARPDGRQPLALKLLAEELRTWRSGDAPTLPGGDTPTLLRDLVDRLRRPENHGATMVRTALGSLAAARRGLSETEMLEVLFEDPEYRAEFLETSRRNRHSPPTETGRIPIALWARLRADLAPYLVEHGAAGGVVMTFHHRLMSEFVAGRFVNPPASSVRNRLIDHFERQPYFRESIDEQRVRALKLPPAPRPTHLRKIDELPWLLRRAGRHDALAALFQSLEFLEAAMESGWASELIGEFRATLEVLPSERRRTVERLAEAVEHDLSFLARYSTTLFQCLWNRCWWYDTPEAAAYFQDADWPASGPPWTQPGPRLCELLEGWKSEKEARTPGFRWIRSLRPPETMLGAGLLRVFSGHRAAVTAVVPLQNSNRLVTASEDGTIRLWSRDTGRELKCIDASDGPVTDLIVTPDEQFAVATALDGTVRIWEVETGDLDRTLFRSEQTNDYCKQMTCLAAAPDASRFAVGGNDEHVRIWSWNDWVFVDQIEVDGPLTRLVFTPDSNGLMCGMKTGVVSWTLSPPVMNYRQDSTRGSADLISVSPDGHWVASGTTGSAAAVKVAFVFRARNGRVRKALATHPEPVTALAFTPDNCRLIVGYRDRSLRIWDIESEQLLSSLSLPAVPLVLVLVDNGRRVLVGMKNGEVREIPLGGGAFLPRPNCHRGVIVAAAYSPCGRQVATAGGQIRLWDGFTGAPRAVLLGNVDSLASVHFAPDGRLLAVQERGGGCWLWDTWLATALARFILPRHVRLSGFTGDGQWLLALSEPRPAAPETEDQDPDGGWPAGWCAIEPFTGNPAPFEFESHRIADIRRVNSSSSEVESPSIVRNGDALIIKSADENRPIGWFPVRSPEYATGIVSPAQGAVWAFGDGGNLALAQREGFGSEPRNPAVEPLNPIEQRNAIDFESDLIECVVQTWGSRLSPAHFIVAHHGSGTIEQVLAQLNSDVPQNRKAAAESLLNVDWSLRLQAQVCERISLSLLGDSADPQIGEHVLVEMLFARLGSVILPSLLIQLDNPSPSVRRRVLHIMRVIGPTAQPALPEIIQRFTEGRLSREEAMPVLSHVGVDARLPLATLEQILRFPYDSATDSRHQNLYDTAWTEAWTALRQLAQDEPKTLRPALPTIVQGLTWGFGKHRVMAARVLGEMGSHAESATPVLIQRLQDEERHPPGTAMRPLRGMAAWALGRIHPERAADYNAVAYLSLENWEERNRGASHFCQEGRDATIALPLLARLVTEDPDHSVRYHCALALGNVDAAASEAAIAALARALDDSNPHVREAVLKSYSRLRPNPSPTAAAAPPPARSPASEQAENSTSSIVMLEFPDLDEEELSAEIDEESPSARSFLDDADELNAEETSASSNQTTGLELPAPAPTDSDVSQATSRTALQIGLAAVLLGVILIVSGRLWAIVLGVLFVLVGSLQALTGAALGSGWVRMTACPRCGSAAVRLSGRLHCLQCGPLRPDESRKP